MIHTSDTFFDIFRNLTAYSRVFTEKLTVAQLVTNLFACQGTKKKLWYFRKTMSLTRTQNGLYPQNSTKNIFC